MCFDNIFFFNSPLPGSDNYLSRLRRKMKYAIQTIGLFVRYVYLDFWRLTVAKMIFDEVTGKNVGGRL